MGHDTGHRTLSKDTKWDNAINRFVGEVSHSVVCLTPFVPWQLLHRKHNLNHNHLTKDYSHQWIMCETREDFHPLMELSVKARMLYFLFLYFVYLFTGIPDRGHVLFYG